MNISNPSCELGSPSLATAASLTSEARLALTVATEGSSDLNALLAGEQTSIMRAEAEGDEFSRMTHEGDARAYRALIGQTSYPARLAHDFGTRKSPLTDARKRDADEAELEILESKLLSMEKALASALSGGLIGKRYNTFAHRSRVIRLEKRRISQYIGDNKLVRSRLASQRPGELTDPQPLTVGATT